MLTARICGCVKHLVAAFIAEEMSEEMPLGTSRFDNFDLKYYPDKDTKDGNPRRRMTKIFKTCYEYAFEFDPKTSGNLLFMGDAGLGKTHLTLAMVGKIIEKGFVPVYGSAENLFSQIEKEKFTDGNRGAYDAMIKSDLLVIDDLGAEMAFRFSKSALYNLVNTRLLAKSPDRDKHQPYNEGNRSALYAENILAAYRQLCLAQIHRSRYKTAKGC